MKTIYLDYNASTPIVPEVVDAMRPFLSEHYGNPSSLHWAGAPAKAALERARAQVAGLLECAPHEVVFTSGGSEANNHAIKGAYFALRERGDHFVTTTVEHPAVMQPLRFLERLGAKVTHVPVDGTGRVDPEAIRRALTPRTILVCVMHANNEVGTIQPIAEIAKICRARGVLLHTDAAQSVGKIPTRVSELGVDLLTIAGHKLYAPKGVGALYIREGVQLEPLIHGAGHESSRRAGTENVLLAVALGAACELVGSDLEARSGQLQQQRDHLHAGLVELYGTGVRLNGHPTLRLPNTLNVSFADRLGSDVLQSLEGIAASTGSACHSGRHEPSAVLTAMGVKEAVALGAVRFSLGRGTTIAELNHVLGSLRRATSKCGP